GLLFVDLGGGRGVVGPHRADQALAEGGAVGPDEAYPAGEHLVTDLAGADLDAHVVVAALGAPRAGGVLTDQRLFGIRGFAPFGEIQNGRRYLLDEPDGGAPRGGPSRCRPPATSLLRDRAVMARKSASRSAGSATMSTPPSSAVEILRSSLTCQSVPTPRQSQVNLPSQAARTASSCTAVS